jgi:L-ascorbate metabolism protein UlaG (beta-lactamase superfamily)
VTEGTIAKRPGEADSTTGGVRVRSARAPRRRLRPASLAALLAGAALAAWPAAGDSPAFRPAHHRARGFQNVSPEFRLPSTWARVGHFVAHLPDTLGPAGSPPRPLGRAAVDHAALADPARPHLTWVGHATLLVQLDGVSLLTDPAWSSRVGPFGGTVGVQRITPPGVALDELPRIDAVLISHDHYDHLDEPTVREIHRRFAPRFLVPLGLGGWLRDRGITDVVELDWGESSRLRGLTITCTPAQHHSGRTAVDQGRRLWASWVVSGSRRLFFAGDTGYAPHLAEIGRAFGPFDAAALPIGGYTPPELTRRVHTSPEDALRAFRDLGAARFVAIHWGTYALGRDPFEEPRRRLEAEARRLGLDGDRVWVLAPGETRAW